MRLRYIPWQSLRQRWHREEQRTYGMRLLEKSGRRSFVSESSHGRPCAGVAVALWRESPLHTFRKQLDFLSVCTRYIKDLTRMSNPVRICPDGRLRTVASTFFDLRRHLENLIARESMQGTFPPKAPLPRLHTVCHAKTLKKNSIFYVRERKKSDVNNWMSSVFI